MCEIDAYVAVLIRIAAGDTI